MIYEEIPVGFGQSLFEYHDVSRGFSLKEVLVVCFTCPCLLFPLSPKGDS